MKIAKLGDVKALATKAALAAAAGAALLAAPVSGQAQVFFGIGFGRPVVPAPVVVAPVPVPYAYAPARVVVAPAPVVVAPVYPRYGFYARHPAVVVRAPRYYAPRRFYR